MTPVQQLLTDHIDLWTGAIEQKSSAGRGGSRKQSLYGIKKLRELILELAVRGKLVPQDPNDEPASELLKRIAAERDRLLKAGEIKKPKKLPEIGKEEKPFELPEGWEWSQLNKLAEINPKNVAADDTEASFVPMPLISTSYTGQHDHENKTWAEIKKGYTHFADGDLAIAKITPCFENSKAAIFSGLINGIGAGTTELHVARIRCTDISKRFVLLCLKSPAFLITGESKMTGSAGQKRVPKEFFISYPLPIPPKQEQHRIVAKVDELMALCDQLEQQTEQQLDAHQTLVDTLLGTLTQSQNAEELAENWARLSQHFDTLFTTEASIDQLKQTILQLAVMGKLVPQDPNDEPASELLKRIEAEKAQLIKEGKIKKQKPLPAITDEEKPFELPKGWEWCRVGDIAELISGKGFKKSEYSDRGARLFQITNVSLGYTKWEIENFLPLDYLTEYPDLELSKGDVLIALNRPLLNGKMKVCIIGETDLPAILYQRVGKFRIYNSSIDTRLVYHYLQSGLFIDKLSGSLQGSDQPFINQGQLIQFLFSIPPRDEQHRIVTKIDELFTLCDQLNENLNQQQITSMLLTDTLVSEALN